MKAVKARAVGGVWKFQSSVNIASMSLKWDRLEVTLLSGDDKKAAEIVFKDVIGFRVLEEGDLLEFWPTCAANSGWLFEIDENGWFELETSRAGFIRDRSLKIKEYFVASQRYCLSVLCNDSPDVEIISI